MKSSSGTKPKVFVIGFQKTGTTSLGKAIEKLGYRVCGAVGCWRPDIRECATAIAQAVSPDYDAFEDNPWPLLYREMDAAWPASRFILTTRKAESWLASMRAYFVTPASPVEEWLYGSSNLGAVPDARLVERYRRHNAEIEDYFRRHPQKLLTLNLEDGLSWQPLCRFLDCGEPKAAFPPSEPHGPGAQRDVPVEDPAARFTKNHYSKAISYLIP